MVYTYNRILFTLKKKEILQFVTIRIKLEDILLSEVCQSQEGGAVLLVRGTSSSQMTGKSVVVAARAPGEGRLEPLFRGCRVYVLQDERSYGTEGGCSVR